MYDVLHDNKLIPMSEAINGTVFHKTYPPKCLFIQLMINRYFALIINTIY